MALRRAVVIAAVLAFATSAEARFGKGGSSSSSSSSSASTSSGTRTTSSTSSSSTTSSSSGGGTYHGAAPVNSGSYQHSGASASSYRPSWGFSAGRPWRYGYYSGAYVPRYGYGYGCYSAAPAVYGATVVEERTDVQEPTTLRLDAGAEAMPFINGQVGVTLGVHIMVEGDAWGFALTGQNITVRADDGSNGFDNLQQVGVHVTYAFLSGKYGRLRAELGGDAMFAPDVVMMGPTGGLSGSLWIGGPFALEGAVFVTPLPFKQLDYRAGLAVGLGAVGLRAGWRTQILDDNGAVDGVVHRDVFMGPYVGASIVF